MINLLPSELKQDYHYARRNRRLLKWGIAFGGAIVGVAFITGIGLFTMNNSINTYKAHIATTQNQLTSENSAATQQQVANIANNLKLMVKVLSKEVLFSKLLTQLGTITPSNVELTNLSIAQDQSAVDITAQTADYNAATQLQVNLADPGNQIFTKADIVSITCATGQAVTTPGYPCTADIRAQFTQTNPFLFINAGTQKAGAS